MSKVVSTEPDYSAINESAEDYTAKLDRKSTRLNSSH